MTSGTLEFTVFPQGREFLIALGGGEEEKDVLVRIEVDFYYGLLILTSRKFDEWSWAELAGNPFQYRYPLSFRVEIGESAFSISGTEIHPATYEYIGDEIDLATYEYKEGLRPPVKNIWFYGEQGDLKALTTHF